MCLSFITYHISSNETFRYANLNTPKNTDKLLLVEPNTHNVYNVTNTLILLVLSY